MLSHEEYEHELKELRRQVLTHIGKAWAAKWPKTNYTTQDATFVLVSQIATHAGQCAMQCKTAGYDNALIVGFDQIVQLAMAFD